MKKLLLSSIAVCIVFLSQAQIKKGTTFLGGDFSFLHQSTDATGSTSNYKSNLYSITPSISWAVKDNLVFGFHVGYTYSKDNSNGNTPDYFTTLHQYRGGAFLRPYKYLGSGFSLFGQTSLDLTYSKGKNVNSYPTTNTAKGYIINLGFYPGVAYTVNRHWQLETGLPNLGYINYTHSKTTVDNSIPANAHSTISTFGLGSSLSNNYQFNVGVLYII